MRKVILATVVGNVLEFYDLLLFVFFVPLFSNLFFPYKDSNTAILMTYATFAVGLIMRPLGGLFIGHIGDKYGRKPALTFSILMMAIPTTLIGLLPTYETIGVSASVLLIGCRLFQGFCTGGEYNGAGIFALEHSKKGKVGLTTGIVAGSSLIGSLIAQFVAALATLEFMPNWSWRVCFLFGGLMGVIGLYIRLKISESPEFNKSVTDVKINKASLYETIRSNWKNMVLIIGASWIVGVLAYTLIGYTGALLKQQGVSAIEVRIFHSVTLILAIFFNIASGAISDYVKKSEDVIAVAAFSTFLLAYPLYLLLNTGNFAAVICTLAILAALCGFVSGSQHVMFAKLFPVTQRYTGISFSYSLAMGLFGGTAPYISEYLTQNYSKAALPSYLMFSAFVSLLSLIIIRNRSAVGIVTIVTENFKEGDHEKAKAYR